MYQPLHRYTLKATFHSNEPEWKDVFKSAQNSCPNMLQLVDLLQLHSPAIEGLRSHASYGKGNASVGDLFAATLIPQLGVR